MLKRCDNKKNTNTKLARVLQHTNMFDNRHNVTLAKKYGRHSIYAEPVHQLQQAVSTVSY